MRTKEQIIQDSIKEGYELLESGNGDYTPSVKMWRARGYDVRYWYMTNVRDKNIDNRTYDIYGLLKSIKKSVKENIVAPMRHFDINPESMDTFGKMLGITSLAKLIGVESTGKFNSKQKKAQKNIKYCSNDQWANVNSWYDAKDMNARSYMLDAEDLFSTIYDESLKNVYDEGSMSFGAHCESYLKDIRFCGKEFLERVCFFYTIKLMEEAFHEVEGTMEDAQKIMNDLTNIKERIGC